MAQAGHTPEQLAAYQQQMAQYQAQQQQHAAYAAQQQAAAHAQQGGQPAAAAAAQHQAYAQQQAQAQAQALAAQQQQHAAYMQQVQAQQAAAQRAQQPGQPPQQQQQQQQYQQQQQQQQPQAAAGGEECIGNERNIMVSGCTHATVGAIARGTFTLGGENHGRPAWKKDQQVNGLDVMIYFWDQRDGPTFSGWWFGPKIGGDQVWAYHSSQSQTPPKSGWKVPYDGPVDPTFIISKSGGQQQQVAQYQQQMQQQQMAQMQQMAMQKQQQAQQQQQQQSPAQQQQQMEQMKKAMEEQRAKQQEQQELQRKQMEDNRKKLEEAKKRSVEEQRASLVIRSVLAKVKSMTAETLEDFKKELEAAKAAELENCGSQKQRMETEITQGIEAAETRVELSLAAEKKFKEDLETCEEMLKQLEVLVDDAELSTKRLKEEAEALGEDKDPKADEVAGIVKAIEEAGNDAKEKNKSCTDFIYANGKQMRVWDTQNQAHAETSEKFSKLMTRVNEGSKGSDALLASSKAAAHKAGKRAGARTKMTAMNALFDKFDADKDGFLNQKEVKKYAQTSLDFKISDAAVADIFKYLVEEGHKGVKKDQFHWLQVMVGVQREKVKDGERRKAREDKEQQLKELKVKMQAKVNEAAQNLEAADVITCKAEEAATSAGKDKTLVAAELLKLADQAQELVTNAKEEMVKQRTEVDALPEGADESLKQFVAIEVKKLNVKIDQKEARLTKANNLTTKARDEAKKKEQEEMIALEKKAVAQIKLHQSQHKLENEAMFADIDTKKDEKVDEAEFKAFFARCDKAPKDEKQGDTDPLTAEELVRAFGSFDEAKEGFISKDVFINLIRQFKKVIKDTVLTSGLSIKDSETKRRLEVGEVVEIIKGPEKEEAVDVMRVHVKVMKDDLEGWITLSGNDGALFLEDGGSLFKVVKETILTSEFELDAGVGQATRKLKQGEVVEVREWAKKEEKSGLMRMKCKARSSGMIGWVTTVGNQGNVYLEGI